MKYLALALLVACLLVSYIIAAPPDIRDGNATMSLNVHNDQYINANKILMFVTNHGNFGRDLTGVFGRDAGTFYPYIDNQSIEDGSLDAHVLYANGLWMGGKVSGETRVTIAEYSDEYVPGPMQGGTFMPDNSSFRVYKLYKDSLADNPNWDYLNWPVDQGAPVNQAGSPLMLGDQMLWTVYNDADPVQHNSDAGETAPLGVEVQQTMWASADAGPDSIPILRDIVVSQSGSLQVDVNVYFSDPALLTGHDYAVIVEQHATLGPVWNLIDLSSNDTLRPINHTDFSGDSTYDTQQGFALRVIQLSSFVSFEVVSNGAGPLNPSEAGALWSAGFPVPTEVDPSGWITDGQQVGEGHWAFHTTDNGGTNGGGTRGPFSEFVDQVTRSGYNYQAIGRFDYEMRFTGSNDNPGVAGGYAFGFFGDENGFWVPFELWNIGIGTPDDPSDDIRLVPFNLDVANTDRSGDNIYALESWGSDADGTCSGYCEHSVSGDDDDPFTDWVYWYNPTDMTPGETGYLANEAQMLAGTFDAGLLGDEVFARTVLVNLNGGDTPPFNQDCPEKGTVFRIQTQNFTTVPTDTFTFSAMPPQYLSTGPEGVSIYVKYNLFNKGNNNIEDFYLSLWVDPDAGEFTDDLIGCDTLNDIGFCYNDSTLDTQYGLMVPAVGFKLLQGPLVYTGNISDVGIMWGASWPQYRNMGMTSFNKYINGTDPNDFNETYNYMQGLSAQGYPYMFNGETLLHMHSGDPVTGVGDLDRNPEDRRMMANTGPITFAPGDSTSILYKLSVGQGADHLSSITKLKEILNAGRRLAGLMVTHNADSVVDGESVQLGTTGMFTFGPYGGPLGPPGVTKQWRSLDTSLAQVDPNGLVTGNGAGIVTIQATVDAGDITVIGETRLTILPAQVRTLTLEPDSVVLMVASTVQLRASGEFTNDSLAYVNPVQVTWESRNTTIAQVSTIGGVTGVTAGRVYILGTANGVTDSIQVIGVPVVLPYPANPTTAEFGNTVNISAQTPWQNPQSMSLCYRQSGKTGFTCTTMNPDAIGFTGVIPDGQVGLRGVEYYFKAVYSGAPYTIPQTVSDTSVLVLRTNIPENEGSLQTRGRQYMMIGFPFDLIDFTLADIFESSLGSPDNTKWRVGRWNSTGGVYNEYPDIQMAPTGSGLWLITLNDTVVSVGGRSTIPNHTAEDRTYFDIPLLNGWNQISTPFAFSVDWDSCVVDGTDKDVLWAHDVDQNAYVVANVMRPFEGYFLMSNTSNANLHVRCLEQAGVQSMPRPGLALDDEGAWSANLEITSGASADLVNVIGVAAGAMDGPDSFDFQEPPPFGDYVSLSFVTTDDDGRTRHLAGDVRPLEAGSWNFDMLVQGNTGQSAVLNAEDISRSIPGELEAALVDKYSGRFYDLRREATVTLLRSPTEQGHFYELLIGEQAVKEAREMAMSTLPPTSRLAQNYPNPFNPSTNIDFSLPGGSHVEIVVFNILGRKVAVLVNDRLCAGHHTVQWDGIGDDGTRVSSGIYFYRIKAEGFTQSKKMVLLK